MDLFERLVEFAGDVGLLPVELVGAVLFALGGYKLYEGNKGATDTLSIVFHWAGFLLMCFSGGMLVAMLCTMASLI